MWRFLTVVAAATAVLITSSYSFFSVDAFQIQHQRPHHDSATSLSHSDKWLPSRRDILKTTITTTASLLLTQPVQAKDDSMNYQAVWFDPKHPNGYRVLFGDDQKATLLLRDEPSDKERMFPVQVVKEEGKETKLIFDGGVSSSEGNSGAVEGIFTRNREKIRIISFNSNGKNNNNSFWILKKFEGPIGVYKDSTNSKRVIIIRQIKGSDCVVEFRDSGRNNEVLSTFTAKAGTTFTFDFPDRGEVTAVFNLFRRTLTFDDGTVWTKY